MLHRVIVVAVKKREHSDLSACETLRVIAYRAECSCGWRGGYRGSVTLARQDRKRHLES